jgi:DNA-binding transcriptional regulator YhcF (GntR family)
MPFKEAQNAGLYRPCSATIAGTVMIRLWLSRAGTISIQEQLSAQLVLGILSRRLAPGERLPSVRELARRLNIHPNTVSAVYQELGQRGWVTVRRGSGVFVRQIETPALDSDMETFVRACLEEAATHGFPRDELLNCFQKVGRQKQTFLVVDPDINLARVLAVEIGEGLGTDLPFAALNDMAQRRTRETRLLVTPACAPRIRRSFPDASYLTIGIRSMQDVIAGFARPPSSSLIGVVSCSKTILGWTSTLLSALGFPPDSVLLRWTSTAAWISGLSACDLVAVDAVSGCNLPVGLNVVPFRIVAQEFIGQVRAQSN